MYCTKCGKEMPESDDKICEECKKKLLEEIEKEGETSKNENNDEIANSNAVSDNNENIESNDKILENIEETMPEVKNETIDTTQNENIEKGVKSEPEPSIIEENEKEEKKESGFKVKKPVKEKKLPVALIICIILILILASVVYILINSKAKLGNTIGNIRNYGYSTYYEDSVYFLAPDEMGDKVGIFKIKKNGKDKQELYMTENNISALNVYKGYVYFIETKDEAFSDNDDYDNKIYRMKTDGSNLDVINDNELHNDCYEIYVVNNAVYYIDIEAGVSKMDLNGENKEKVMNHEYGFLGITDKYIVYNKLENETDEDYVTYIADINGENQRPILKDTRLYSVNVEGDYIYYTNENKNICVTKIDSNETKVLYDNIEAYNLNTNEGYAYYLSYLENENQDTEEESVVCIFRLKLDGTSEKPENVYELDTYSAFIDIVGDWVVYMDKNNTSAFINMVNKEGNQEKVELYFLDYEKYYNSLSLSEGDYYDDAVDGTVTTSENNNTETDSTNSTADNTNSTGVDTSTNEIDVSNVNTNSTNTVTNVVDTNATTTNTTVPTNTVN